MAPKIEFVEACNTLSVAMLNYKVIHRYALNIPWSFKFEKRAKQYDPVEILYMHVFETSTLPAYHISFNKLVKKGYPIATLLILMQLSNGVWKRFIGNEYATHRDTFQTITGIYVD
jgi:hypothetical protein